MHCFRSAHTEFSLISLLCRRKNLLRSCSFVKFFFGQLVVLVFSFRCQLPESTVFYSRLEVILHFATVYLIGFCFRGTLHSVFYQFFNCFLTGIASLNITAHNASHRKGTQIRFLRFFQNRFSEMEVVCKGSVVSCHEYPWSSRFTCRCEDYHAQ